MKRILVIGSPGAGKSHFSRRLSEVTGIPVIHLDRIYWKPGWIESDKEEFDRRLVELMKQEQWIIDGNYGRTMAIRLERADTAVMLDLNRWICTFRVFKRSIFTPPGERGDMAEGCNERIDLSFLKWTWQYPGRSKPSVLEKLQQKGTGKKIYWLRSRNAIQNFLVRLEGSGGLEEFELWK